ncbi:MAG: hypothetical protein R3C03_22160 [Pirellulaceae bacterium]
MDIIVQPSGSIRCIYGEAILLSNLGQVAISRGSFVEPDTNGHWTVNLSPVNGPELGPFSTRSEALRAEVDWLNENWLVPLTPDSLA